MGHLDRYKKPGGFLQLLSLLESFGGAKQEKFLSLIEEENPTWAKTLKEKILTVDRIFAWPSSTLAEIVPRMPISILAIAVHGLKPEQQQRLMSGLPHGDQRKIQNEFELVRPQPNEIISTHLKLVDSVRKLVDEGTLRLESIEPSAVVDEKTEEMLLQSANGPRAVPTQMQELDYVAGEIERSSELLKEAVKDVGHRSSGGDSQKLIAEIKSLQNLVMSLQKENKALKADLRVYKDKLEAIKKIA